ncbi:MAG: outer membrane lipoprotein chaperone LolA [Acidobacteriota bacterium]|nr:outer membrane lipoprotein chaperone LolA [Acidobacteriota bacterium]
MKRFSVLLFAILCLGAPWLHAQAGDARPLAARVDARYNSMKSLRAEFTEIYSGNGVHRREGGTLLIKRPGKMRWDYTSPRKKLFVTSGNAAWFYVPGERQARKTPLKSLDDLRSPLRYLLGRTKLEKELHALSLAPDVAPVAGGSFVLRGVPVGMGNSVSQVLIEADNEGFMRRIAIVDLDGSTTEFRLANQQVNTPVRDAEFQFTPPAGVEVLQGKDVQP